MSNQDERSLEQVYHSAVSGLYARIRSNYDFLYHRLGDEGLVLISDMSREYGLSILGRAKNRLSNNDLASVACSPCSAIHALNHSGDRNDKRQVRHHPEP